MRTSLWVTAALLVLGVGCTDEYTGPRSDGGWGDGGSIVPGVCHPVGVLSLPTAGGTTSVSGTTSGARNQAEASCGSGAEGPDNAWLLSVPSYGQVTLVMTSTGFDTVLHVRSACSGGTELGCNDDSGGTRRSELTVTLSPGMYYVIADGYSTSSSGTYVLELRNVSVGP